MGHGLVQGVSGGCRGLVEGVGGGGLCGWTHVTFLKFLPIAVCNLSVMMFIV